MKPLARIMCCSALVQVLVNNAHCSRHAHGGVDGVGCRYNRTDGIRFSGACIDPSCNCSVKSPKIDTRLESLPIGGGGAARYGKAALRCVSIQTEAVQKKAWLWTVFASSRGFLFQSRRLFACPHKNNGVSNRGQQTCSVSRCRERR